MQKRNAVISCSVLQQTSSFGSAKVLGGRLQNPECPFQGGRSGLWGDVEKRLSEGSCIPCLAGHWVLQQHFHSRPFSGPVNSPAVLVTSSRVSTASEHHLPGESGDRKYQCEVIPISVALYYKIFKHAWGCEMVSEIRETSSAGFPSKWQMGHETHFYSIPDHLPVFTIH